LEKILKDELVILSTFPRGGRKGVLKKSQKPSVGKADAPTKHLPNTSVEPESCSLLFGVSRMY
jgi:hypothetical protein